MFRKKTPFVVKSTLAILLAIALAHAGQGFLASGTFHQTSSSAGSVRVAGGNIFFTGTLGGESTTGTIQGNWTVDGTLVRHADGDFNFAGLLSFTNATVDGKSGGLTIRVEGTGQADGSLQGHFTVLHGTGDLANLHGEGTLNSTAPHLIDYVGTLRFTP